MLVFYVMTVAQHSLLTWLPHLSASIPLEESAFSPSLGLRSFQPAAFSSSLLVTTPFISLTCGLFISLCPLFRTPILCFQSFAHSFCKNTRVGTLAPLNILCASAANTGFARPLFSYSYELPFPEVLSFDNHPNCPGVALQSAAARMKVTAEK